MQVTPKKSFDGVQSRSPITPVSSQTSEDSSPCGRFIPSRSGSNLLNAFDRLEDCENTLQTDNDPALFRNLLHNQLFGCDSFSRTSPHSKSSSVLKYAPHHIYNPYTNKENVPECIIPQAEEPKLNALSQSPRKVPKLPYKVLDAPQLPDDFYLNLVDWSKRDMLAVGLGSSVYLWSAASSAVSLLTDLPRKQVSSLAWTQSADYLAVGANNGKVQLFDIETMKLVRELEGHQGRVGTMSWNSSILSTGSKDRHILHRDIRVRDDYISKLVGHKQEVCGLKWSPDSQQLASGGNDNKVNLWNLHSCSPLVRFDDHTAAVKAIAWSPHQHGLLASGGGTADRSIRFWNTLTYTPVLKVDTGSQVCSLAFSKNSNELVSTHGYSLNQVMLWKYPGMQRLGELMGHTSRVLYLALSADGQNIVTGAGDETLRFWKVFPKMEEEEKNSALAVNFGEMR